MKHRRCYYFNDMINDFDINSDTLLNEKLYENIQFKTFHTKLQQVKNHCVIASIK